VSIFYDPMISKLIAWGETREDALRTMSAALRDYQVVGLPNNLSFLQATVRHPLFVKGGVDTSFLAHHLNECLPPEEPKAGAHPHFEHPSTAAAVALAAALETAATPDKAAACGSGPWSMASPLLFSRPGTAPVVSSSSTTPSTGAAANPYSFVFGEGSTVAEHPGSVSVRPNGAVFAGKGSFTVTLPGKAQGHDGESFTVTVLEHRHVEEENAKRGVIPGFVAATTGTTCAGTTAVHFKFSVCSATNAPAAGKLPGTRLVAGTLVTEVDASTGSKSLTFYPDSSTDAYPSTSTVKDAPALQPYQIKYTAPAPSWGGGAGGKGRAAVVTPMPGKVVKVHAKPGQEVKEGEPLMVLEAMKMEHNIKAPTNGVVSAINYNVGDFVNDGAELVAFKAADEAEGKKKGK
jgi:biotin carboxyl carrier protein